MLGREIKQGDGWSDWAVSDQAVTEDFMEEVAAMPNSGGGAFQKERTARARLPLITATCGLSECPSSFHSPPRAFSHPCTLTSSVKSGLVVPD